MKTMRMAVAAALAFALAACASQPGIPGDFERQVSGVQYYAACGNEVLVHEGTTWYPIVREGEHFPVPAAMDGAGLSLPRVPAPESGDDVGTLWIYEGGYAFFRSDSGKLETWLTTQRQHYAWVC